MRSIIRLSTEFATAANLGVITKAGTNEFHGRTFWDYNTSSWNSRSFFAKTVPFRVYHDFGVNASGPIVKNKLFFLASYEGSRERAKTVTIEDVPLEPWRKGDFSGLLQGAKPTVIKNPFTGLPFTNNQIPPELISSVSQKAQEYFYPLPNSGGPGALSSNWQQQFPGTTGFTRYDHFDARVDYQVTSRDAIFGRVSWRRLPLEYTDLYPLHVTQLRRGKSAVFSWNRTLSPSAINEFRFGATYHVNPYWADVIGSDLVQQFGIKGISTAGIHDAPIFQITGVTAIDLDAADAAEIELLWQDLSSSDNEDEIAYRGGRRFVARLRRAAADTSRSARAEAAAEPVALTIAERGILDNLRLTPITRRAPAAGEVEIEVAAAGLNFRDVLIALGQYPGAAELGSARKRSAGTRTVWTKKPKKTIVWTLAAGKSSR